jgi:hypothetical protein
MIDDPRHRENARNGLFSQPFDDFTGASSSPAAGNPGPRARRPAGPRS